MSLVQRVRRWNKTQRWAVFVSGLFCVLAIGHFCWFYWGPQSGLWGPRFACAESFFDCGEVSTNRDVEHQFVIENTGRQTLHILKVVPGCGGCMTAKVSQDEIAPGDTCLLNVVLNVAKLKKGAIKKAVLLKTDDPNLPKVVFYIYGTAV